MEGYAAIAGLVSIDLLSTRWLSTPVLSLLGWFTTDYVDLGGVEDGIRITSIFLSPNVFAGCMGIGVLLGLGLAVTAKGPGERVAHVICLSVNALAFLLAFSMGACAAILPAFLVLLALILLTSPVMLACAVGVKLSSPGPVLFKQERVGRNKEVFYMYKFRISELTAPVWGGILT